MIAKEVYCLELEKPAANVRSGLLKRHNSASLRILRVRSNGQPTSNQPTLAPLLDTCYWSEQTNGFLSF